MAHSLPVGPMTVEKYYPDVMAACGPEPTDERIEAAPSLVVAVSLTLDAIYEGVRMPSRQERLQLREEGVAYGRR